MNRECIKMPGRSIAKPPPQGRYKRKPFTGSKTGWRAAKRLGFQQRLSFYGRVILSSALRASHIVTGCFGTVFAPALTQFPVMPELPNLGTSQTRIRYNAFLPYSMAHLVFPLIYPFGQG